MNELTKTFIFIAVAAVIATTAFLTRPRLDRAMSDYAEAREPFSPNVLPDQVKGLEVSAYDKARSKVDQFSVKLDNGIWTIPSHNNYPADAQERLKKTAGAVLALQKDGVVPGGKELHKEYGVVDPNDSTGDAASWGTRIKLTDASGNVVSDLIVGKDVPDKPGFRFVRRPENDRVYQSKADELELTTRFADWINTDLITDPATDFSKIDIHDYKLEQRGNRVRIDDKGNIELSKDDKGAWVLAGLKEGEETDVTKATDVANAISDIKILGVRPKPAGLTPELNFLEKQFTAESMISRGFFPTEDGRIVSNDGEVKVETNDGLVYTLRFGGVFLGRGEELEAGKKDEKVVDPAAAKPEENKEGSSAQETQENRFLLVSVAFDEKKFPPIEPPVEAKPAEAPKTQTPAAPAEQPKEPAPPAEAKPEEPKAGEAKPAEPTPTTEPKPADAKPEAPASTAEPKTEAPAPPTQVKPETPAEPKPAEPATPNVQNVAYQEPAAEAPKATEPAQPTAPATPTEPAAPAEPAKSAEAPAATAPAEATPPAAPTTPVEATKPTEQTDPAKAATEPEKAEGQPAAPVDPEAARKFAEEQVQRDQAMAAMKAQQAQRDFERRKMERERKIEEGKKKAKDLEARYGQWFYVVSNADAMKIRQDRAAFIKKPEAPGAANPAGPQGGIPGIQGAFPAGIIPGQPPARPAGPQGAPAQP